MKLDTTIVFGLSTEGASLESAHEGSVLRRLRAEFLGESGRAVETFYFDSVLIYVERKQYTYDAPLSGRVSDSVTMRFDLLSPNIPPTTAESLRTVMADLRSRMPRAE